MNSHFINVEQLKSQLYYSLNQVDKKLVEDEFENNAAKKCPKCKIDMNLQRLNTFVSIFKCPDCMGFWLSDGQLKLLTSKTTEGDLLRLESTLPQNQEDNEDFFHFNSGKVTQSCPDCKRQLREVYFKLDHNIKVDICEHCRGVFYDYGELTKVSQVIKENKKSKKLAPD